MSSSPSPRRLSRPNLSQPAASSKTPPGQSPTGVASLAAATPTEPTTAASGPPRARSPRPIPPLTPVEPATAGSSASYPPLPSPGFDSPSKKRKAMEISPVPAPQANDSVPDTEMKEAGSTSQPISAVSAVTAPSLPEAEATPEKPPPKKHRTNTPWTPAEEKRLKVMRDESKTWSEIAKTFPNRTEGSVKKHWYKDMHYADFAEDESQALLQAIKEYDANKWKVIGQKVGKPAKACEQYAKEHFAGRM